MEYLYLYMYVFNHISVYLLTLCYFLFFIYNVFKVTCAVAYRPDGPSVKPMLITIDIYTLQKVYISLLINKLLTYKRDLSITYGLFLFGLLEYSFSSQEYNISKYIWKLIRYYFQTH